MPTALCANGHWCQWHATRGSRLADRRCLKCGGSLRRAYWTPSGWTTTRPAQSASTKGAIHYCAICERNHREGKMVLNDKHGWICRWHGAEGISWFELTLEIAKVRHEALKK